MTGKFILLAQLATFLAQIDATFAALTGSDVKYTNAVLNDGKETTVAAALNDIYTKIAANASASDLETLAGKVKALESLMSEDAENPTAAIDKFNEIVAFLNNISNTQSLEGIISGINDSINAKYTKPEGGIPKADMAAGVQTSLGKADTALQEGDIQVATDADILALFAKDSD